MRFLIWGALFISIPAAWSAGKPAVELWKELAAKRAALPGYHQEFAVTQVFESASGSQSSKRQLTIDAAALRWRESRRSGSGETLRLYDGQDLLQFDAEGEEFVRLKQRKQDGTPVPAVYSVASAEPSRATEIERRPCGLPGRDHECVVIDMPARKGISGDLTINDGIYRFIVDTETGLVTSARSVRTITPASGRPYRSDLTYVVKRLGVGPVSDPALLARPARATREVKELSAWRADRINKTLGGKPAPELEARALDGTAIRLADYRGKIVLLDFWTTWCPPCRADAPALEKLAAKYGEKDLVILGISVSEDRKIVETYLAKNPHTYPVILTTENEMPRPYQVGAFPTYLVIDREGNVLSAVEGDQGFGSLRKLLRKAGIEAP